MTHHIEDVTDTFWNIRGSYRILGVLDVQTQCSLVRLGSGGFVMLDSYTLDGDVRDRVLAHTDGGRAVEAVINLHPFHTVHVEAMHAMFPGAKLYGTARHHQRFAALPWEPERSEDPGCAEHFAADLDFMVPEGVQLVTDDENVHFSSVLAFHRASHTLHVDDTLSWFPLPWGGRLHWHPTLGKALEPHPDAPTTFRRWAETLAQRCESVRNVCTAHARGSDLRGEAPGAIAKRVRDATGRIEHKLRG